MPGCRRDQIGNLCRCRFPLGTATPVQATLGVREFPAVGEAGDVTVDVIRLPFYAALLPLALWIGEHRALPSANTGRRFVARRDGDRFDLDFTMQMKAPAL